MDFYESEHQAYIFERLDLASCFSRSKISPYIYKGLGISSIPIVSTSNLANMVIVIWKGWWSEAVGPTWRSITWWPTPDTSIVVWTRCPQGRWGWRWWGIWEWLISPNTFNCLTIFLDVTHDLMFLVLIFIICYYELINYLKKCGIISWWILFLSVEMFSALRLARNWTELGKQISVT